MSFGDYWGPDKDDKGQEGGSCNRSRCQDSPAIWYNHGSHAWYCEDCREDIEFDTFNKNYWDTHMLDLLGYPMFETREMITARKAEKSG